MPAKLLSDRGVNFTSALVELCSAFGIQKCRTTAYHAQCNGQVERFHQTLFRMIGKLSADKKAQWELHLPELLQAYNSTRSTVTGYSPHFLMFGRQPCLPVDFFFPTIDVNIRCRRVPTYVEEVLACFKEAYTKAQHQSNSEVDRQKRNYDRATSTVQLMPGDTVLKKADTFQGKRKVKDQWSKVEYEVIHQVMNGVPSCEIKDASGNLQVAHHN